MTNFQDFFQDLRFRSPSLSKCNSFIYQSNYDEESIPYGQSLEMKIRIPRSRSPSLSGSWVPPNYSYFGESEQLLKEQDQFMKLFQLNIEKSNSEVNESPPVQISQPQDLYELGNEFENDNNMIILERKNKGSQGKGSQVCKKLRVRRVKLQQKKVFKGKNCCKNIILNSIRTIENPQYYNIIDAFCSDFSLDTKTFISFYSDAIFQFTGFRAVRDELIITGDIKTLENKRKAVFRMFLNWYLKDIAALHILRGKTSAQNKKLYIAYKNQVLLKYVNFPETWESDQLSSSPP